MAWQRNKKNVQDGFTLVELLVVVAILTILITGIFAIYSTQIKVTKSDFSVTQTHAEMGVGLNAAVDYIKAASAIAASATIDSQTYSTNENTLVLTLPAIDSNNLVIAGVNDTVVLRLLNNDLVAHISADPSSQRSTGTRQLVAGVDFATFVYENTTDSLQSKYVTVEIAKTIKVIEGQRTPQLSLTGYLRNR